MDFISNSVQNAEKTSFVYQYNVDEIISINARQIHIGGTFTEIDIPAHVTNATIKSEYLEHLTLREGLRYLSVDALMLESIDIPESLEFLELWNANLDIDFKNIQAAELRECNLNILNNNLKTLHIGKSNINADLKTVDKLILNDSKYILNNASKLSIFHGPAVISNYSQLVFLELSYIDEKITFLKQCINLEWLYLNNCKFEYDDIIDLNLKYLSILDTDTLVTTIDSVIELKTNQPVIWYSENLKKLSIGHINIEINCPNLNEMDVSATDFNKISNQMSNIKKLTLTDVNFDFNLLPVDLEILIITWSVIKITDHILNMKNLKYIRIFNSTIKSISPNIANTKFKLYLQGVEMPPILNPRVIKYLADRKIKYETTTIYDDDENIHNSHIQETLKKSISNLVSDEYFNRYMIALKFVSVENFDNFLHLVNENNVICRVRGLLPAGVDDSQIHKNKYRFVYILDTINNLILTSEKCDEIEIEMKKMTINRNEYKYLHDALEILHNFNLISDITGPKRLELFMKKYNIYKRPIEYIVENDLIFKFKEFNDDLNEIINEMIQDNMIFAGYPIQHILLAVCYRIMHSEHKDEILNIINTLPDACPVGTITNIINSFVGFFDDVEITVPLYEQIAVILKRNNYNIDLSIVEFKQRGITEEEYGVYIDELTAS